MRERLAAMLTALATAAFVAAAVAWPISYRRAIGVAAFGPDGRPAAVVAAAGSFHVLLSDVPTGPMTAWTVDLRRGSRAAFEAERDTVVVAADRQWGDTVVVPPPVAMTPPTVTHNRFGLAAGFGRDPLGQPGTWFAYASAPAWLVVPLLSIVPATGARRWAVRRRRARAGRCLGCGYDLRGSPARCPECGRPGSG